MATTGELQAIIQDLHLIEIGDAASYLGEEGTVEEEFPFSAQDALLLVPDTTIAIPTGNYVSCQLLSA
ncbi:MAG: hypothetical protein M3Z24_16985 [Chloroflexota bacterium]|nr:hypothetical protein [Chloroflexota bacterium]